MPAFPWGFLPLGHVDIDSGSTGQMGLISAHLSQVSIREAVQVLLKTTDVNCVLIPGGIEVRMVRVGHGTAAWAALEGITAAEGTN